MQVTRYSVSTVVRIECRQDYCNSLLFRLPVYDIKRLQSVQIAAAQLFGRFVRRDHAIPVLRDQLHWLPITQRMVFKTTVSI